jgi:hypothetical protein
MREGRSTVPLVVSRPLPADPDWKLWFEQYCVATLRALRCWGDADEWLPYGTVKDIVLIPSRFTAPFGITFADILCRVPRVEVRWAHGASYITHIRWTSSSDTEDAPLPFTRALVNLDEPPPESPAERWWRRTLANVLTTHGTTQAGQRMQWESVKRAMYCGRDMQARVLTWMERLPWAALRIPDGMGDSHYLQLLEDVLAPEPAATHAPSAPPASGGSNSDADVEDGAGAEGP